jgi:hypothetical protein
MTTYAETLLGAHDHKIICMDQSGCKLPFPVTELHRFLVIFYYCWISTAFDAPL